jgi:hypothetical protein
MASLNLSDERRARLVAKLLNSAEFYSVLPEVETLVFLEERGLAPAPEPMAPAAGPDFAVARGTFSALVEVCSLGGESIDREFNLIAAYISQKMQKTPSRYLVVFDISGAKPYSALLRRTCVSAQRFLRTLEAHGAVSGTLYLSEDAQTHSFENGDFVLGEQDFANPEKLQLQEVTQRCPIRISYELTESEPGNHTCTTGGGTWFDSADRIRGALSRKLRQLPRDRRNVLIVDWSHSALDEHDFLSALYGRTYLNYELGQAPREGWRRDGFFSQTTRVQAVVSLNRNLCARIEPSWTVFPTDNPESPNRMTLEELHLFGELRKDLIPLAI